MTDEVETHTRSLTSGIAGSYYAVGWQPTLQKLSYALRGM
jgi:hypothetical protein